MASRPVPAFFEPGAPPPALPLPTCQTNLAYFHLPQATSIWRQELQPRTLRTGPVNRNRALNRARSSSPYTKPTSGVNQPQAKVTFAEETRFQSPASELTELSDASTRSSSEAPSDVNDGMIPKPPGEVSRPKRGGYNLQKALGWPDPKFGKLQV